MINRTHTVHLRTTCITRLSNFVAWAVHDKQYGFSQHNLFNSTLIFLIVYKEGSSLSIRIPVLSVDWKQPADKKLVKQRPWTFRLFCRLRSVWEISIPGSIYCFNQSIISPGWDAGPWSSVHTRRPFSTSGQALCFRHKAPIDCHLRWGQRLWRPAPKNWLQYI